MKYLFIVFLITIVLYIRIPKQHFDIESIQNQKIKVEIRGAIKSPGYYELDPKSTIQQLLDMVYLKENADISQINPSIVLKEDDVLIIPYKTTEERLQVSINTGTLEQLMLLPGIGEKTALTIIRYREENGLFQTIEEIQNIKGIKEKKYEKIKEYLTL